MLLGDQYLGAASGGGPAHGNVSHVRTFQALRCASAMHMYRTMIALCGTDVHCSAEALLKPDPLHHYSLTILTTALGCMQQHGGSAWTGDEVQGEGRFDAQHSGRGAAQQGLLPDPKEDANRVIEDILAVSAFLTRPVLLICSSSTVPPLRPVSSHSRQS